ncbi:carbamate kinase [Tissierella sp.]|uniref:carbamate kinase n=1 Tax=Tissierella sp. TaxID=41274 RepID=UPI002866134F|nr:carbamate kinase [Tissierella sp.]MDR7855288.1 carbamate kinase [Tissierella sp.]
MNKKKRIVIALGGNALGNNLEEQKVAVKTTATAIVDLIEEGCEVVIAHGNGPQVGMIHNAMSSSSIPLYISGAMSQTYIGFDLENALREELLNRKIQNIPVTTIMTQIVVDREDPSFQNPTKPIGRFMSLEEANLAKEEHGFVIVEDSGRGYRRVVPSPAPIRIVEIDSIKALVESGQLVISCGGGGIPVIEEGNNLKGIDAVIDKDFASGLLAKELDADFLIILTAVEKVAINFGKENEKWLSDLSIEEAKKYIEEGHFAPGSMLPKIVAAMDFAGSKAGRSALITLLEKAKEGIKGDTGTRIHM